MEKLEKWTADEPPLPARKKQLSGATPLGVKWENVGNVFWLGGDLIATAQSALRGAPKEAILKALAQARHHISELGLNESTAGKQLSSLKSDTESLPEGALDRAWRSAFAAKIYNVTGLLDLLLREQQSGYRPNPES